MFSKNHSIILFIDRSGFSVYQDTLSNIPKFNFTPDLVTNLDVVNKDQFVSLIETFIQINKMVSGSLAVILSDSVIYMKDLENPSQDSIQNFLENIPFEEILAKVIKTGNSKRITAVNKDLVMTIIDVFVKKGAVMESIVPGFMYGQNVNFTAGLTLDSVRAILENTEILKSGNLLTDQDKIIHSRDLESGLKNQVGISPDLSVQAKKPGNPRQYILIGIFLILLIILAVVYLASRTEPQRNTLPVSVVRSSPAPTQATVASLEMESIKVKIVQSAQADERAVNLKNELLGIGLQDISNEISEASVPEKSSIVFSRSIPVDLRNSIIVALKKILPDASILESQDIDFTIKILIGKS